MPKPNVQELEAQLEAMKGEREGLRVASAQAAKALKDHDNQIRAAERTLIEAYRAGNSKPLPPKAN